MRIKNRSHAKAENDVFFLFRCRPQRRVLVVRNCRGRTADKGKAHPYTETPCLPINYQLCASVKLKITNSVRARRVVQIFLFQGRPQRRVLAVRNCRGRTADKRKRCAAIRARLFSDVHLIIRTADKSSLVQTLETLIESVHSLRS